MANRADVLRTFSFLESLGTKRIVALRVTAQKYGLTLAEVYRTVKGRDF